jgi:hypothetical protein
VTLGAIGGDKCRNNSGDKWMCHVHRCHIVIPFLVLTKYVLHWVVSHSLLLAWAAALAEAADDTLGTTYFQASLIIGAANAAVGWATSWCIAQLRVRSGGYGGSSESDGVAQPNPLNGAEGWK